MYYTRPIDDGGFKVTSYIIQKMPASTGKWVKVAEIFDESYEYLIQNLEADKWYVRVFAVNIMGPGEPSNTEVVDLRNSGYGEAHCMAGPCHGKRGRQADSIAFDLLSFSFFSETPGVKVPFRAEK